MHDKDTHGTEHAGRCYQHTWSQNLFVDDLDQHREYQTLTSKSVSHKKSLVLTGVSSVHRRKLLFKYSRYRTLTMNEKRSAGPEREVTFRASRTCQHFKHLFMGMSCTSADDLKLWREYAVIGSIALGGTADALERVRLAPAGTIPDHNYINM